MSTLSCPHCRQSLEFLPHLAKQMVQCTHCRSTFFMPPAPGIPPDSAGPPDDPPLVEDVKIDRSRYRPRFVPREYVGLRTSPPRAAPPAPVPADDLSLARDLEAEMRRSAEEAAASLYPALAFAYALVMQVFLITCFAIPGVIFLALGQLIGLLIHVQLNTQEAAHHLRHLVQLSAT
jgi:hypothetical protein